MLEEPGEIAVFDLDHIVVGAIRRSEFGLSFQVAHGHDRHRTCGGRSDLGFIESPRQGVVYQDASQFGAVARVVDSERVLMPELHVERFVSVPSAGR